MCAFTVWVSNAACEILPTHPPKKMLEWRRNLNLNASLGWRHHVGIQALPGSEPVPAQCSERVWQWVQSRAGGCKAARAVGICHRLRSRTRSKDNTDVGLVCGTCEGRSVTTAGLKADTDGGGLWWGGVNRQQQCPVGQSWKKYGQSSWGQSKCLQERGAEHRWRIIQPCH